MSAHRKKLLVAVLGLLALAYSSDWVWSVVTEPLQELRKKQRTLERDLQRRQLDLVRARKAAKALENWSAASLPADPQVARSVYQAWLLQLVSGLGLSGPAVDSTQPSARGGYLSITFSLHARGTLRQWTQFLYEFYRAGYLHQLRSLAVTPLGKRQELDVDVTIEALVLPTAEDAEQLEKLVSDRLAYERFLDYQPILTRNLFAAGPAGAQRDATYLTGINTVGGVPEAWFTFRNQLDTDRAVVKLRCGQDLVIGQFQAKVLAIHEHDVVLEADGERWLLSIGEKLGDALALPPALY
jgi:hypothetical protein